jgi:hypothetical protein
MYNSKQLKIISSKIEKITKHYDDGLFSFDYIILLNDGLINHDIEYYDCSITIFNINDHLKRMLKFTKTQHDENNGVYNITNSIEKLKVYHRLLKEVESFIGIIGLKPLIIQNIFIYSSEVDEPTNNLTESKMNRLALRTIIKDILMIIKQNQEGEFYLPEDINGEMVYSFTNSDISYSVELTLIKKDIDGFNVEGYYSSEDDVIEIGVEYNPQNITKNLYDLVGELNEVLAHEMEHVSQHYSGEFELGQESPTDPFEYYTQPHEINAQKRGFYRISKLKRVPYEKVVRKWFDTHKSIHKLNQEEMDRLIDILLS